MESFNSLMPPLIIQGETILRVSRWETIYAERNQVAEKRLRAKPTSSPI